MAEPAGKNLPRRSSYIIGDIWILCKTTAGSKMEILQQTNYQQQCIDNTYKS